MPRGHKKPSPELLSLGEKLNDAMATAMQADINFFNLARKEYDDGDGITIATIADLVPLTYATCRTRVQSAEKFDSVADFEEVPGQMELVNAE